MTNHCSPVTGVPTPKTPDHILKTAALALEMEGYLELSKDVEGLRASVAQTIERPEPTSKMIDAALNAWFASPPSETDQGLERSMKAALEAALKLGAAQIAPTLTALEAASKAMVKGHRNCKNYFDPKRNCDCDLGAIDGCKARLEAIAAAISDGPRDTPVSSTHRASGHTDLMVTPESIDAFLDAHPLPSSGCVFCDHGFPTDREGRKHSIEGRSIDCSVSSKL